MISLHIQCVPLSYCKVKNKPLTEKYSEVSKSSLDDHNHHYWSFGFHPVTGLPHNVIPPTSVATLYERKERESQN